VPSAQLFERVVVAVDVQGFSARNVRRQLLIQDELDRMLTEAAEAASLDRLGWDRRGDGDGEVAVLPADIDLLMIVRRFVTELDQLLTDHNEDHRPETRIRLRIAMNLDSVVPGGRLGHGGKALIDLARLIDSQHARKALDDVAEANLAQIISESLFQRAVVPELGGIRQYQFRKVVVDVPAKGFRQDAYIYLPCGWPERRPVAESPPPPVMKTVFPVRGPWPDSPVTRRPPLGRAEGRSEPESPPVGYDECVTGLLVDLREAMDVREYAKADGLTTRILLEAAGRGKEGSLRTSDAERLPAALLTELDSVWAAASKGGWGFAAQRRSLPESGRVRFHPLSLVFGWRQPDDALPPRYAAFVANAVSELPFFPTLRSPDRENGRDEAWREQWRTTVVSVHIRLHSWE
jgi:hypothetical protein